MLYTFPALSIFLFVTGAAFNLDSQESRLAVVATFIYLFMIAYSPGLGPVPFTYSAEAFPLNVRALGMASATAVTWMFNFIISFTWPKMMATFTTQGGFYWYAGWNIFGLIFAYFLVPETKRLTLEELDDVFSISNHDFAREKSSQLKRSFKKKDSGKAESGFQNLELPREPARAAMRSSHTAKGGSNIETPNAAVTAVSMPAMTCACVGSC